MYLTRNQAGVYSASGVRIPPSPPDMPRAPDRGLLHFVPDLRARRKPTTPAGPAAMRPGASLCAAVFVRPVAVRAGTIPARLSYGSAGRRAGEALIRASYSRFPMLVR